MITALVKYLIISSSLLSVLQLKVCIEAAQDPSNSFSTGNSAMERQVRTKTWHFRLNRSQTAIPPPPPYTLLWILLNPRLGPPD